MVGGVEAPVVLTINGSDPTGYGCVQADLKTFSAHHVYGAAVVTSVDGPGSLYPLPATAVGGQLSILLAEMHPAATKIGVVGTAENAAAIASRVRAGDLPNLVLDPVFDANDGHRRGVIAAVMRLIPEASVITPNIDEAGALVGWPITTTADMAGAAAQLASRGAKYCVITGGRLAGDESIDAVWTSGGVRFLHAPRVDTGNVRGTGATFSAAIAANLALGAEPPDAVAAAKDYVGRALTGSRQWQIGYHAVPLDHMGLARVA
jgi:hydroxymethylpyrimidine kinase/phosphomethylpyrimidine kinase